MKNLFSIAMVCVLILNSGCTVIDAELHNRGGYLDKVTDNYWFKADSKRMRALRAFAMQASLARIASVSPKNDQDRTMMAIRIGNATTRAKYVIECGFTKNPVTGNAVDGDPCFYFDSLMVDYTTALFDLAMIAFPVEDTKNLLSIVVGGFTGPVGALEALNGILALAKEALKYGRVIGALYRDTVELEVQIWISSASAPQDNVPPEFRVTPTAVVGLQRAYARGNDNMPVWIAHIDALRAAGLEPVPDPRFIHQLSSLMTYMCGLIVNENNPQYSTCVGSPVLASATPSTSPAVPATIGNQKKSLSISPDKTFVWRRVPLPQAIPLGRRSVSKGAPISSAKLADASADQFVW